MAVTAYASLNSLAQDLYSVQSLLSCKRITLPQQQLQNFQDIIQSLQEFLENPSQTLTPGSESSIQEIPRLVVEAEFIIDKQVVDQLGGIAPPLPRIRKSWVNKLQGFTSCFSSKAQNLDSPENLTLDKVILNLHSIYNELLMVKSECNVPYSSSVDDFHAGDSSRTKSIGTAAPFGFEKHVKWVIDQLCSHQKSLQVLPIVGMGGIGKTTLTRYVLETPRIKQRFDRCFWCTISQEYNVVQILQVLLRDKTSEGSQRDLGGKLHQELFGRRYLIVMDDMWTIDVWEKLKLYLPDNRNGSRVIVTTRMSSVGELLNYHKLYPLDFLDEDTSWDLLCETIFGGGSCPDELEGIGKNIAKSCKGLPLSLVTIGGLLSKTEKTTHHWENVAENVRSFASYEDDERCLRILSLSYSCLPIYLKPGFLYFANFPTDKDVKVMELIRQWIAQGLVKPVVGKTMEDVAEEYLKYLIDRNLVLIRRVNHFGKIKACGIHDLFRELCFREIDKEDFLAVATPKLFGRPYQWGLPSVGQCIMCRQFASQVEHSNLSKLSPSRLVLLRGARFCKRCSIKYPYLGRLRFMILVDVMYHTVLNPTTSRYIKASFLAGNSVVPPPSSILYLWNLQFLKLGRSRDRLSLPGEIWELQRLRHLEASTFSLPEPKASTCCIIDLQILYTSQLRLSKQVTERISNLKKLKLFHYYDEDQHTFAHLQQLESLHFHVHRMFEISLQSMAFFPCSLKKLCLDLLKCDWKVMSLIGLLPNLQVLNLKNFFGIQSEWNVKDGEFLRLKVLMLQNINLCVWRVEDDPFPQLEKLIIRGSNSSQIPLEIGDIGTLCSIHLENLERLGSLTVESVQRLAKEQLRNGNSKFQLYIGQESIPISDDWNEFQLDTFAERRLFEPELIITTVSECTV